MIVGSGYPVGPNGPKYAAHAMMLKMIAAEKNASFHAPTGTKGTPRLCTSSWYSCT